MLWTYFALCNRRKPSLLSTASCKTALQLLEKEAPTTSPPSSMTFRARRPNTPPEDEASSNSLDRDFAQSTSTGRITLPLLITGHTVSHRPQLTHEAPLNRGLKKPVSSGSISKQLLGQIATHAPHPQHRPPAISQTCGRFWLATAPLDPMQLRLNISLYLDGLQRHNIVNMVPIEPLINGIH